MKQRLRRPPAGQSGVMLLEALIAILVFALGVLALVGLQTVSIKQSSEAKFRADAVMLANEIIGQMWVTDRSFATLNGTFATGAPAYNAWLARITNGNLLPGVVANPPTVQVAVPVVAPPLVLPANPSSVVTVTVNWKAPNEPVADPVHTVTVVAQIR
jgi:type IV pilus assembly protein PilV